VKTLTCFLGLFFSLTPLFGAKTGNPTGKEIMEKVDNREDGKTRVSNLEMILISKTGNKRTRKITSKQKDYGKDSKMLMIFEKPADVKGTGYLAWEFNDPKKDDSRWLYMPAMRKLRRISGSSEDDYFMGTDFTYEDMGERNVEEDTHTLFGEEKYNGHKCWKIKSIPKSDDDKYTKRIVWVRKDINMIVKVRYFNEHGLLKILTVEEVKDIDDIWVATKMIMDNKQKEHKTILNFENMKINIPVPDNLFRPATLKRGSVRH